MKTTGGKIAHNSFWYSLEMALETIVFLGTSVAVARYLGPAKLGYFSYINFFVTIVTGTGGAGLATATRKFMAEYIALDQLGTARAVYEHAHRYQLYIAIATTVCGLAVMVLFGDPAYHFMSAILLVSIIPGLMSRVPAQANQAFEDVSKNTISALGYIASYTLVIVLTLRFGWDLPGVAAASLIGRTIEVFLRTIPLNKVLRELPVVPLERKLIVSIRRFCLEAMGIQLLMAIVWDRSELFFLRAFSSLEQIGFYSISYTLTNNLLTPPRVLGYSAGVTLMIETGKDRRRVQSIVNNASRYMLIAVLPTCLGAASIMLPAVRLVYGQRYLGAIQALIISALLCVPRAFQWIPENLLRTADKQKLMLLWYSITAVVNVTLDYFLIKRYGAVGAAWGNGLAQGFGVIAIWYQSRRFYEFHLPKRTALRILASSLIMSAIAYTISHRLHGFPGLILAILAAVVSYIVCLRLFHAFDLTDRGRLGPLGNRLPKPLRRAWSATIHFATLPPV